VATIDMSRKEGGAAVLLSRELGPRLVQCGLSRGLLPYQAASSSIQPFGHNRHGQKFGGGGCAFFLGVAGSTSNTMSRRPTRGLPPYQVASLSMQLFHLDPCSCLATIDVGRKLGGAPPLSG